MWCGCQTSPDEVVDDVELIIFGIVNDCYVVERFTTIGED